MDMKEACFPVTSLDKIENRAYVSGSFCNVVNFPASTYPKPMLRTEYIARPMVSRSEPPTPRVARTAKFYQGIGVASTWVIWQRLPAGSKVLHRNSTDGNSSENSHGASQANTLVTQTRHLNTPESTQSDKYLFTSRKKSKLNPPNITITNQSPRLPEFPCRQASYIQNLKKQKRSVSAKPADKDKTMLSYAPVLRVNTAPSFLSYQNHKGKVKTTNYVNRITEEGDFLKHLKKPYVLGKQTIRPFDKELEERIQQKLENKQMDQQHLYDNHENSKHFKIQRRIILSELNVTPRRDTENYIASIRRDYLHPDQPESCVMKQSADHDNRINRTSTPGRKPILVRQDDGDLRIDHLLQYPAKTGKSNIKQRKEKLVLNPDGLDSARSITPSPTARSNTPIACTNNLFNKHGECMSADLQKMMLEKRFYLRTPEMASLPQGAHSIFGKDLFNCNCDLCNLEVVMCENKIQDSTSEQVDHLRDIPPIDVTKDDISVSKLKETWCLNDFRSFLHGEYVCKQTDETENNPVNSCTSLEINHDAVINGNQPGNDKE